MSLSNWRKKQIDQYGISQFYYISLMFNIGKIIDYGILPKNQVGYFELQSLSFADESVQTRRHDKIVELSNGCLVKLHDLVPVYLNPRNPTLHARKEYQKNLVIISIDSNILCDNCINFSFTDGNAGSERTMFYKSLYKLNAIPWDVVGSKYWIDYDDGKRRMNSEFLIYPKIDSKYFNQFIVNDNETLKYVEYVCSCSNFQIETIVDKRYFFG